MDKKVSFCQFLGRCFMAHPMLFAAPVGVVAVALVEAVATFTRLSLLPLPTSQIFVDSAEFFFLAAGVTKAVFIGVPAGCSCGGALKEWRLNNREGCREICRAAAKYVIFGSLFFSIPTFCLHLMFSTGQTFLNYWLAPIYFSTFSLQLGLAILFLCRWLPVNSEDTVQVTKNLRL